VSYLSARWPCPSAGGGQAFGPQYGIDTRNFVTHLNQRTAPPCTMSVARRLLVLLWDVSPISRNIQGIRFSLTAGTGSCPTVAVCERIRT